MLNTPTVEIPVDIFRNLLDKLLKIILIKSYLVKYIETLNILTTFNGLFLVFGHFRVN